MPRIIITEPGKSPQPYRLKVDRAETKIGRGSDNDILIEAGSASTHHCVMKRVSGGFILEDLGSTNGIKVNDALFRVIDLEDEMSVKIGDDVTFEFTLTEEEIAELGSEEFVNQQQAMLPKTSPAPEEEEEFVEDVEVAKNDVLTKQGANYVPSAAKSGAGTLFFFIFAILALALGFYIRHYQDVLTAPAKETPAAPAAPAAPATPPATPAPVSPTE